MGTSDHRVLQRYVPRVASEWGLDAGTARWREVESSLVFVDLSGFTALSERLARRGKIGAEELTDVLNRVFSAMLGLAYERGGSLLKFGGDALLLHFTGEDHPTQAACAAVEMRAALRDAASVPTSVGRVSLRMSVGIHSGPVQLFRVGTNHHELIITGEAATTVAKMEAAANAGEILVSPGTAAALPFAALGEERDGGRLLRWRRAPLAPCGVRQRRGVGADDVVSCMPEVLRRTLGDGQVEPEHRMAVVGFLKFSGVERIMQSAGFDGVADALHDLVSTVQAAADVEGCTFLASDVDKDGGKIILTAGVPATQDDDDGRMLRTMRHVLDAPSPFVRRVGVNRGHVFAGAVGSPFRATFTAMGDTVNVAARLMASAGENEMYCSPLVAVRSRTPFVVTPLPPLPVKGKTEPLTAVAVGPIAAEAPGTHEDAPAALATLFVGREAEVDALDEMIERARSGHGSVVRITGPTGVGKSRLLVETLDRHPDLDVVWMRGDPTGRATPYRAVRPAVLRLLGLTGDGHNSAERLSTAIVGRAPHLGPLVPLVASALEIDVPETPETASIERRFRPDRTADVIADLLAIGRTGPLVIVAEDAQWFDRASASTIERIAAFAADRGWIVTAVRRPSTEGCDPQPDLAIDLGVLDDEAAATFVKAGAPELRHTEVDAIVRRSGGNPLFLHELLRTAREAGVDELPDTLQEAVSTELDALSPPARRLVRCASVLGNSFPTDVLRELIFEEHIDIDDSMAGALARFLDGDGSDGLRFRHAMMREVVYEGLTYRRRRELHLRAGRIVEQLAGTDPDAAAETLSMHAALGHDHVRAWRFASIAGERARERYANVEAVTHYERAIEAARRLGGDVVSGGDVAALWRQLGDAQEQLGLLDEAMESYRRATALVAEPMTRADLLWRRAGVRMQLGEYRAALADASRGRRLLDGDDRTDAAVWRSRLIALQACVRQNQQRVEPARRLALEAAALAEVARDGTARASALLILDWAHRMGGHADRESLTERALEIYQELGDLDGEARASNNLGGLAYFEGEWERAEVWYRRALGAFRRAGNETAAAVTASNLGELLVSRHVFDDAREMLRDAVRVLRAAKLVNDLFFAELQVGRLLLEEGASGEAVLHLTRVRDDASAAGQAGYAFEAAALAAVALTQGGDHGDALAAVDDAVRAAGGIDAVFEPLVARVRAMAHAGLGDRRTATAEARAGLAAAQQLGLLYDEALLRSEIDRLEGEPNEETLALFRRLGIADPLASSTR